VLVVADASPIILLSRLHLLDLLDRLYDQVVTARAVYEEVVLQGAGRPGSSELPAASWIQIIDPEPETLLELGLQTELGRGEAAALSLAASLKADLVLMDERQGRLVAKRLGLSVKGTVGILIAAQQKRLIPELRPLLDELTRQGARLSPSLRNAALTLVEE
jgi:predicted nucleic acid-binding protein